MKLSWSHKLFFKINNQLGKNKLRDLFFLFCAHWLIYVIAFEVLVFGMSRFSGENPEQFIVFTKLLITAILFAITFNWLFGLVFPHRRPIIEFPETKQLFKPYKTWKSFPSDHTTIAFILVFIAFLVGAPVWFFIYLLIVATLVAISRIYTGVHYPRDIIGGLAVALVFSYGSYWLLENITQPIYDYIFYYL
jgi:undecaprenyl-diphosphatase